MTSYGSMQWCGPGWTLQEYTGPLKELGQAIPREYKRGGISELVYHLAFGYTSGFPVSHILYWSFMVTFRPKATQRLIDRAVE